MVKGFSEFGLMTTLCVLMFIPSANAQTNPWLQISNTGGSAVVSWLATNGLTFYLQSATTLPSPKTPNPWVDSTVPTILVGNRSTATLPMTNAQQFFRLKLPLFSFGLGTPVFQFAIFYNSDLEISPDQPMTVNGKVFCNGSIWASPDAPLTFQGNVMCTGAFTGGGGPVVFQFPAMLNTGVSPETGLAVYTPIYMAIYPINNPTNLGGAMLEPPPTGENPNSSAGQERFYNFADLIVTNSSNGVITAFFQDSNNVSRLTYIPPDATQLLTNLLSYITNTTQTITTNWNSKHTVIIGYSTNTTTTITTNNIPTITTNSCYSFATGTTFYDYREGKTVQAVQIDVGNLAAWITNDAGNGGILLNFQDWIHKGHGINSLYVYSGVPLTGTQLPAVRLVDGQQLPPSGLTIATPMPLYVLGNYNVQTPDGTSIGTNNTVYTCPSAFLADAVTVLSSNWNDGYDGSTTLVERPAVDVMVNAAILQGIVPSATVGDNYYYSGGAENFLRLLEDWSTHTFTYNGSMVAMFDCRYATSYWQSPGNYYNEPTWQRSFDTNFLNPGRLPPGTPNVVP
jgi:hypothetical protein